MKALKYGCFGCLGVLAILLVAAAAIYALALQRARATNPEDQVLTQDLPAAPSVEDSGTAALPPEAVAADLPAAGGPPPSVTAGHVLLDLSGGEFEIGPGDAGSPARVEATYDRRSYELQEAFDLDDQGAWTYRISFRRIARSSFLTSVSEILTSGKPKVRVFLPPDVPMDLGVKASQGGSRMDLGGIWLRSADIECSMGGVDLDVSRPLREPMERLSIDLSMGGGAIRSLGNASPRLLEVRQSMGGMHLDLRGQWTTDARITVTAGMGGAAMRLPSDVVIEGLGPDHRGAGDDTAGLPTLTFAVSSEMGELEIVD